MNRLLRPEQPRLYLMLGTFVVPLVLLSLATTWYWSVLREGELLSHAEETASILSEGLASAVAVGLSEGNFDLVQKSYDLARTNPQLIHVSLLDSAGTAWMEHSIDGYMPHPISLTPGRTKVERSGEVMCVLSPVEYQRTPYGYVHLAYSLTAISTTIFMQRLLSILAGVVVLVIGLYGVKQLSHQDRSLREIARELGRSKNFVDGIVENAPVMIAVKDVQNDNAVVLWNKTCEEIMGIGRSDILGRSLEGLLPEQEADLHRRTATQAVRTRSRIDTPEQVIERPGRDRRIIRSRSIPIVGPDGNVTHILTVGEDISELKQGEADLRAAKEEAEAASRAKSEFLANMSHEIRTPMNGIIGMTELALRTELTSRQQRYLRAVQTSADALLVVINDILDFSKMEAGKLVLERVAFDLEETIENIIRPMSVQARKKHLGLILDVARDVPGVVLGDPYRLTQVVTNLISNALKFTEQGEVVVRVRMEKPGAHEVLLGFSVTDSGVGVPEEKLRMIFESFTQADLSTTRKYGGTGLGLAICSGLVRLMGGTMNVRSTVGKGSTFSFAIPFGMVTEATMRTIRTLDDQIAGLRIAVVDSNAATCRNLSEAMTRWQMFPKVVDRPWELPDVLASAETCGEPFDLVVMDSHLPEVNGFELARAIQSQNLKRPPQILILTSGEAVTEALQPDSAVLCLEKPFKLSELLEAIHTVKERAGRGKRTGNDTETIVRAGNQVRVLVVEDHKVNQELALGILEMEGYAVSLANDGREAIDILATEQFDVVLMDVQMPQMDGMETTGMIRDRERGTGRHMPIIAMTAHAMKGDREKCLAAGMDDYISKPLRAAALLEVLQRVQAGVQEADRPAGAVESRPGGFAPEAAEVFDREEALRQCLGNDALLGRVLESFLDTLPGSREGLRAASDNCDMTALAKAAHALKGAAGSIVANRCQRAALAVERAAKDGDPARSTEALGQLWIELEGLERALKTRRPTAPPPGQGKESADAQRIERLS